ASPLRAARAATRRAARAATRGGTPTRSQAATSGTARRPLAARAATRRAARAATSGGTPTRLRGRRQRRVGRQGVLWRRGRRQGERRGQQRVVAPRQGSGVVGTDDWSSKAANAEEVLMKKNEVIPGHLRGTADSDGPNVAPYIAAALFAGVAIFAAVAVPLRRRRALALTAAGEAGADASSSISMARFSGTSSRSRLRSFGSFGDLGGQDGSSTPAPMAAMPPLPGPCPSPPLLDYAFPFPAAILDACSILRLVQLLSPWVDRIPIMYHPWSVFTRCKTKSPSPLTTSDACFHFSADLPRAARALASPSSLSLPCACAPLPLPASSGAGVPPGVRTAVIVLIPLLPRPPPTAPSPAPPPPPPAAPAASEHSEPAGDEQPGDSGGVSPARRTRPRGGRAQHRRRGAFAV
ncbi:unnamed protein product, partial [Prorocentrum cordatum]